MPESITTTLIDKYLDGTATAEEKLYLEQWYAALMLHKKAHAGIERVDELKAASLKALLAQMNESEVVAHQPVHRIHFLRTAWFRWSGAAAILIVVIGVAYLWNTRNEKRETTNENPVLYAKQDVLPAGNRAMLTLSDGRTIVLDSANNGVLAHEGTANIQKKDGSVVYLSERSLSPAGGGVSPKADGGGPVAYNTMTTPRGGQYQLTLSDGTKVWLNAESSITYPTSFEEGERERRVEITGEAYFEVTKDAKRPFIVTVRRSILSHPERSEGSPNDDIDITVLGTHFNVRAYEDEDMKTSLAEGSVRISPAGGGGQLKAGRGWTLKPGEAFNGEKIITTNIENDLAWKNGLFSFDGLSAEEAMRQIARWYDVDIKFEGEKPKGKFGGKAGRNLNLSQVVKVLDGVVAKLRLEGRTLYVRSL